MASIMNGYSFTLRGGRMNLVSKLEETASEKPDSIACRFKDHMMTYQELNEYIQRFADGLQEAGMEKGDHLALLLGNSPDFIIAFFGALKAGIVVVPINPLYTPTEIGYMLTNGDVKATWALASFCRFMRACMNRCQRLSSSFYARRGRQSRKLRTQRSG